MCLLTNERYKTYQTGFSFRCLGHAPGVGLGGTLGVEWSKKIFFRNSTRFGVWVAYINGTCNGTIVLDPHPLGPWGGAKRSNIIKSQSQSQFQRFLSQTLCVFSQLKDIKHIRGDFHSIAWVMPQGWDLGYRGGLGGPKTFFPNSTRFGMWVTYMNGTCNSTNFWVPASWGLWEGPKGQIS